jgi:L-amino acid N-acyltransferase YncA
MNETNKPVRIYTAEDKKIMGEIYDGAVADAKATVAKFDLTEWEELLAAIDFLRSEVSSRVVL